MTAPLEYDRLIGELKERIANLRPEDFGGHGGGSVIYPDLADALAALGPAVIPSLAQLLHKGDLAAQTAILALRQIGLPAMPALKEALRDRDRCFNAQSVLYWMGDAGIEALVEALSDPDSEIRSNVVYGLTQIYDRRILGTLLPLLETGEWQNRLHIANWMGLMGNRGAGGRYMGPEEVSAVIVPALCARLKDPDRFVRKEVVEALKLIADPQSVIPLCKALKDRDWTIRQEAAEALGALRDERALVPLLAALKDINWVQMDAANAVAKIGEPALAPLLEALQADSVQMRIGAARALGSLADPRAVAALRGALQDSDNMVRYWTVHALEKIGGTDAIAALKEALSDADPLVRRDAAQALAKIAPNEPPDTPAQ